LIEQSERGQPIAASRKAAPSNVVNPLDAVRASLKESGETKTPAKKATKSARQDDAKITAHLHRHLVLDDRIRSRRAQNRQQAAAGLGEAESAGPADSLERSKA
jgi:hypothetical protein